MKAGRYRAVSDAEERLEIKRKYLDLVSVEMGPRLVEVTDESFGSCLGLVRREEPAKVKGERREACAYDGWETRRNNPSVEGSDRVVFRLQFPGSIHGFNLDTRGIRGSDIPREVKLEAMVHGQEGWDTLLQPTRLEPSAENFFVGTNTATIYDHVRVTLFKDGGLSRLRVYGTVMRPPMTELASDPVDVAFVGNGGRIVAASGCETGSAWHVIMPGQGRGIADGWLTPRSQLDDNEEHILIALARPAFLNYMDLHTNLYDGMRPSALQVYGSVDRKAWVPIGAGQVEQANCRYEILGISQLFSYILLVLHPGGGVMRVHLMGWFQDPGLDLGYGMTLAQEERNAVHRIQRGVPSVEVEHRMDINGDLQAPSNTRVARNLYMYLFLFNDLETNEVVFSQQALLDLVLGLRTTACLSDVADALIAASPAVSSREGIDFLASLPLAKTDVAENMDLDYLRSLYWLVQGELGDPEEAQQAMLPILRALNPNDTAPVLLPDVLSPLVVPGFCIQENLVWFNALLNCRAFMEDARTPPLLATLAASPAREVLPPQILTALLDSEHP